MLKKITHSVSLVNFRLLMKEIVLFILLFSLVTGPAFGQKKKKSSVHKSQSLKRKKAYLKKVYPKQVEKVFKIESEQEQEEENEMYDGPAVAALFEYNRTKDPATGRVPRERLLTAIEETENSKNVALRSPSPSGPAGLSGSSGGWVERGPNSDVPGPSNGNTRANNGLASGRVRAVMVDSNDASGKTVFIGGIDGGLWKTTDITASPATWTLVNDFLSNLAVSAICQDPRPGFKNIMYFCTGESYYNFDAVQGNGVFKSTNGGATWTYLASSSSFVNGTRILCDFQGNVYLGTRGTGLRRSTDGGATWSADLTPAGLPSDICDLEISSTGAAGRLHIVTGIFTSQGYRFTDIPATVASATWNSPTTVFPSFNMRAEIACSGSTLYACPANGHYDVPVIYKSTDGGANWTAVSIPSNALWAGGNANGGQGWYALGVDINPANTSEVIIGGLDTWKSTNAGASWTQLSTWVGSSPVNQYVHADVHKVLWYDGGNKLIVASDGGIFFSSDKGATIRDRNQGLRIKQFYSCAIHPTTANYFLAGAQDNGVHQFNNAGLSSTVEVNGGDGAFTAIDQNQPQFQFGSYVYNIYNRSIDGGATWSGITLNSGTGQFINPFDYDNTANIMYCGDASASYRRWTDPQTGSTSAVVGINNMSGSVTAVSVSPYTSNRVYFGTNGGRVVQVDNANTIAPGSAGTDRSTGLPSGTVSCINQGASDNNLIAVFSNYGINNVWVSTNGGATWTASDGNLPDMPVRWAMFYPLDNSKAIIATETGVWETTFLNGGSTVWVADPTFPTVRTDMLKYRATDGTIVAATHGRGLWTNSLAYSTTPDILFQQPSDAQTETTVSTAGCRGYKDYTYNMVIANQPTGAATVTLGVVSGATATQNVDYELLTTTLTFPNGSNALQPFTVRIYDDAAKESAETFTLNYTISGGTNAQAGTSNQTFAFTINDNDAAPIVALSATNNVGSYNVNASNSQPFRSNQAKFRLQNLWTASQLNAAGITSARNFNSMTIYVVTKSSTVPYTNFTISMAKTSASDLSTGFRSETFTPVYPATSYSSVAGANLFTFTTPFAWDGTSNVLINFCFDNAAAEGASDITEATNPAIATGVRASTFSSGLVSSPCTGAASFISDFRIRATFGTSVTGTPVSTALNSTKTAYLGPNDDVYFYDGAGAIMARIKNNTAFDYGCTQVTIDRDGTASAQFWNSNTPNYLASKSIKVVPTNNNTSGNYDLSLYYTNSEVTGFEAAATPTTFSSSKLVKVSNGFFVPDVTAATPHINDVLIVSGTVTALGTNSVMTGNFSSTGFSGFGVGDPGAVCSSTLSSAVGTDNQALCINTPITDITFSTSGATGIGTALNLPTGVTASWSANVLTITGTPTVAGVYNFSIPFIGCTGSNASGTITITDINTVSVASTASISHDVCINTALTDITHTTSGATGIADDGIDGANGLPTGVSATWASNTITISGTPTASGTFNYSIPLNGGCGTVAAVGVITVKTNVGITSITQVNSPLCGGTRTTLTANGVTGTNALVTWYDGLGGTGNVVGTGLTSDSVFAGTYYAYVTGDCASPAQVSITLAVDVTNPVISCPSNVNVNNTNALNCTKAVALTSPTFSDNCKVKSLSWTLTGATNSASSLTGIRPINGITLNSGTTTITYTVRDFSDLTNTCSFTVTINDIVKPIFTAAPANINVSIPTGCSTSINVPDVSFSDNCGTPSLAWSSTGATIGNGTNQVGTMVFNIGTTTLTYTLTDANSNVRTASILVKVLETELPIITCPTNITTSTVGISCTKNIANVDPSYSDNCGIKSLTWSMTGATSLTSPATGVWTLKTKKFNAGLTTVKYTLTDFSGNSVTCSYNVQLNTTNTCPIANQASSIVLEEINPSSMELLIFPNPTGDVFNVTVKAPKQESINIRVLDVNGKTAFIAKGMPRQTFHFGEQLKIGTYLVEVRQGKVVKTLKAVKIVN